MKTKTIFERNQIFKDIKQYFKDVKQLTDLTYLQNEDYQLIFETIKTAVKFLGTILHDKNQQKKYQVEGEDLPGIVTFINTKLNHYFFMKVCENRNERNSWLKSENNIVSYLESDKLGRLINSEKDIHQHQWVKNRYFKRTGYVMNLVKSELEKNQLNQSEIKELHAKLDILKDFFNQKTKEVQEKDFEELVDKNEYKKYAFLTRSAYQTFYALENKKEKEPTLKNKLEEYEIERER